MSSLRLIAACAAALATTSYAFQSASTSTSLTSQAPHHLNHAMQHRRSISIMQQSSSSQEVEDDEEYELVEFFVSPEQINFLRKEAKQRDARKTLPKFFLPPDEQGTELALSLSDGSTIDELSKLFESDELIEVRGVSKESGKRKVFDTAQTLAGMLEDVFEKPVVIVDIKGFAVKLYCPFDSDDEQQGELGGQKRKFKRIQLRTSYKPGKWTRKPKAIRDERGQVVLDETGKSIKEVPEY